MKVALPDLKLLFMTKLSFLFLLSSVANSGKFHCKLSKPKHFTQFLCHDSGYYGLPFDVTFEPIIFYQRPLQVMVGSVLSKILSVLAMALIGLHG